MFKVKKNSSELKPRFNTKTEKMVECSVTSRLFKAGCMVYCDSPLLTCSSLAKSAMKKIEDGFDNVDQDSDQMEQRGRQGSTSACPNQSESLALDLREEAPPASSSV